MTEINKKEIHFAKLSADGKTAIFANSAKLAEALREQPGGLRSLEGGVVTFSTTSLESRIKDLEKKEGVESYVAALKHGLEVMQKHAADMANSIQVYGKVGTAGVIAKVGTTTRDKKAFTG